MGDTLNYESFHFVSIHKISLGFLYERLTSINYYKVRQNLNKPRAMQSVAYPLAEKLDPVTLTLKINRVPDSLKV